MTNFVLCIHVQIRFASTEKNYSHRLACILFILLLLLANLHLILLSTQRIGADKLLVDSAFFCNRSHIASTRPSWAPTRAS